MLLNISRDLDLSFTIESIPACVDSVSTFESSSCMEMCTSVLTERYRSQEREEPCNRRTGPGATSLDTVAVVLHADSGYISNVSA